MFSQIKHKTLYGVRPAPKAVLGCFSPAFAPAPSGAGHNGNISTFVGGSYARGMNFPPIVRAAAPPREKRATGDASHLERRNTKFCFGLTPNSRKKKRLYCRFWYTKCIGERWGNNNVDTRMNYPPLQPCSDVGKRFKGGQLTISLTCEFGGIDQEGIFHILQCPLLFIMLVRPRGCCSNCCCLAWDTSKDNGQVSCSQDALGNNFGAEGFLNEISLSVDGNPLKLWHIFE
jgi:hypothetical protein